MANAILAAVLSLIIPGVGQIYAGRLKRGIVFLVVAIVCWILLGGGFFLSRSLLISLPGLLYFIFVIINVIDAYMLASAKKTFLSPDFVI
jgi:TM2 domain-containing membrane protein YozV